MSKWNLVERSSRLSKHHVVLHGWRHYSRKYEPAWGLFLGKTPSQQRSTIGQECHDRVTKHNQDENTAEGNITVTTTKGQSFILCHSERAALALLPASRPESCLYRAFHEAIATITRASARLALSHHGTPKPTVSGSRQVWPTHRHTYPNSRPSTINHYSGGWGGGMLLENALVTVTQWATTTPPAPFFPWPFTISRYSSAGLFTHKIDPVSGSWKTGG